MPRTTSRTWMTRTRRTSCPDIDTGSGLSAHSLFWEGAIMESEIWKDIPGYEGRYQASSLGRIRSLDRTLHLHRKNGKIVERIMKGKILRPGRFCKNGHLSVCLGHGESGSPVHQLVALTYLGPCPEGKEVLHINGNPQDNRIDNLRYGTRRENILDVFYQGGRWRKLSLEDVEEIKFALYCGFRGCDLARQFGVSQSIICSIKHGRIFEWV